MRLFVERADSFQGPERMDGSCSASAGTHALLQRRSGVHHFVVHNQTLGGEAPELIATVERRNKFRRLRVGEGLDRAFRTILPNDAVNAAVSLIAQIGL